MSGEIDVLEREDDRAHSPFGPSSAHQWIPCTGRHQLIKKILAAGKTLPPSSKFAAEGTAAHTLLATCFRNNEDAWEHAGELIHVEGWAPFVVDKEMVDGVQRALDFTRAKLEQLKEKGKSAILIVEQRVASPEDGDAYGTSDIIILVPGERVYIIDFKYGKGIVVEPDDEQLKLYGHYVFDTYKTYNDVFDGGFNGKKDEELFPDRNTVAELYIIQPRIEWHPVRGVDPEGKIRRFVTNRTELARFFYGEALPSMQEARTDKARLTVGDHCRYCPAALYCSALHKNMEEIGISLTEEINLDELGDDRLGFLLDIARMAEKRKATFEREAFARAMNRHIIPGSKLVKKIGERQWKNTQNITNPESGLQEIKSFEESVLDKFGADAYAPSTFRTPADLEKQFGKAAKDFSKLWAEKPDTGLTLAATSDRREEQKPDPLENFSAAQGAEAEL